MEFFKEKKRAKEAEPQSTCLVLLYYPNGWAPPLPLFQLIEHIGQNHPSAEASVYLSQNQYLKRGGICTALPTNKSISLSLAIVPVQLLELNGANLFIDAPMHGHPKVYLDTLCPENIIFSVMGGDGISIRGLLNGGHLIINPRYQDFIKSLIQSSTEPVKLLMNQLCPEDHRHEFQENQKAYENFISKLGIFDKEQQTDLLDLLDLGLNPTAKKLIADVKQYNSDRDHSWEIKHQLKSASSKLTSSKTALPEQVKTTIIEYLGPGIPGFSKDLDAPEADESEPQGYTP
ncbi:MAG TPA: hypothetical protein VHE99_11630 [Gammaproteobacteria bacterium]|nr:hypothetical protein [Gammaproteobacteria bacterium]